MIIARGCVIGNNYKENATNIGIPHQSGNMGDNCNQLRQDATMVIVVAFWNTQSGLLDRVAEPRQPCGADRRDSGRAAQNGRQKREGGAGRSRRL